MNKINAKAVDKTLIIAVDGKIYNKVFDSHEDLLEVLNVAMQNPSKEQVEWVIKNMQLEKTALEIESERKIEERNNEIREQLKKEKDFFDTLKDIRDNGHHLLEVKDNFVYLKGINISMPKSLVEQFFLKVISEEALVNFWKLCALNPDARARQDLFDFLKGGRITITPNGYFVAYRNVRIKTTSSNKKLEDAVSKLYLKVKAMKKGPKNYTVVNMDEEYLSLTTEQMVRADIEDSQKVGNLYELYHNLTSANSETTVYTDNHTRTMSIKIGELVQMDRTKCDSDPKRDCSYGLHVGNKTFLSSGSFGNEGLAVLVNPSKVIAVPEYNQNKMRVCEYLPIGVVEYDSEGKLIELPTEELEYEYTEITAEELENLITSNSTKFEEYKKQELIPKELSLTSLQNVVVDLNKINDIVKNRVQKV